MALAAGAAASRSSPVSYGFIPLVLIHLVRTPSVQSPHSLSNFLPTVHSPLRCVRQCLLPDCPYANTHTVASHYHILLVNKRPLTHVIARSGRASLTPLTCLPLAPVDCGTKLTLVAVGAKRVRARVVLVRSSPRSLQRPSLVNGHCLDEV